MTIYKIRKHNTAARIAKKWIQPQAGPVVQSYQVNHLYKKVVLLAQEFRSRLSALVANWRHGSAKKSFYRHPDEALDKRWTEWLTKWKTLVSHTSEQMKRVNPKYTLREWLLAPAYQQAAAGDYTLIRELQDVMTQPYAEQSTAVEEKYYKRKPSEFSELGGLSHMSCSS